MQPINFSSRSAAGAAGLPGTKNLPGKPEPCGRTLFFQISWSGAWPSWASHLHSVSSIWVKTARKEESSGLQA